MRDIHWIGIDPVYVFHVLNCLRRRRSGGHRRRPLRQGVRHRAGRADQSRTLPTLARWTVDPAADRVSEQRLDDTPVEFPRIDDDGGRPPAPVRLLHPARRPRPTTRASTGLVKYDLVRDEVGPLRPRRVPVSPGEPVFVQAADGRGEDEGWILSVVYDATRDASDLVILDATVVRRSTGGHGPPARPGPVRIPRIVGARPAR